MLTDIHSVELWLANADHVTKTQREGHTLIHTVPCEKLPMGQGYDLEHKYPLVLHGGDTEVEPWVTQVTGYTKADKVVPGPLGFQEACQYPRRYCGGDMLVDIIEQPFQ